MIFGHLVRIERIYVKKQASLGHLDIVQQGEGCGDGGPDARLAG
jgi:hypothetical protein